MRKAKQLTKQLTSCFAGSDYALLFFPFLCVEKILYEFI
ncbi:hypothetical protein LEP1GSC202_0695 [Leptospira yanagawae serovar Saopaulo str. Sao Paulo = ATCC 700523]|uniref:Uncharacterized protein n=1 Tax=Leptospira yanagawae serovar Saopaulo str. Sao Paulo = ATCC 700523 TaxID=1249483 RepID=A0A5E8HHX3_9LEPT|nr:hypothetical protein LEP1GSC202_0695 [Leptospira yanagawae serovar Saopaulo str. Sao Paulo = ATCC 700523]